MESSIKETLDKLKAIFIAPMQEAILFRINNIFFGTFIISWILCNWDKIAYFILSKDDVIIKIHNVRNLFDETFRFYSITLHDGKIFTAPLLISMIIGLSYPIFSLIIAMLYKKITLKIDIINIEKETERHRNQLELNKLIARNISAQELVKANDSAEIEEARERKAISKSRIVQLKEEAQKIQDNLLSKQKESDSLSNKIVELKAETPFLEEKLETLKENYGQYTTLLKAHDDLKNSFSQITSTQEENWQQIKSKTMALDKITIEVTNLRNSMPFLFDDESSGLPLNFNRKWHDYIQEIYQRQQFIGSEDPPSFKPN